MVNRVEMLRNAAQKGKRIRDETNYSREKFTPPDLMKVAYEQYDKFVEPIFEVVREEHNIPKRSLLRDSLGVVGYVSEYYLEEERADEITGEARWNVQKFHNVTTFRSLRIKIDSSGQVVFEGDYYQVEHSQEEVDRLYTGVALLLEKGGNLNEINTSGKLTHGDTA